MSKIARSTLLAACATAMLAAPVAPASAGVAGSFLPGAAMSQSVGPIEAHYRNGTYNHYPKNQRVRRLYGHNGYAYKRPGYRRHVDGFWYPVIVFSLLNSSRYPTYNPYPYNNGYYPYNSGYVVNNTEAHHRYCEQRYQSYRRYDGTFQPYHGPRRRCDSPYDGL